MQVTQKARVAREGTEVGRDATRKEGAAKLRGEARYVDDVRLPNMIFGVTVRSQVPRGRLRGLTFPKDAGIPWEEFVVVTAADIPGRNAVPLLVDDQPFLAFNIVAHREEPLCLLAHANRALLERARDAVIAHIEPLPAVLTLDEALSGNEIISGNNNDIKSILMEKGDVEGAFSKAGSDPSLTLVEGSYETEAQEQLYIETNGMIASADTSTGDITVQGSMQCPYYIHGALMAAFGFQPGAEDSRARVIQCETGGGFGGKEEYPSLLAVHAALLARKAGRPVKMIYDRGEDMAATTKRHPSRTKHRTLVDGDGKLVAMDIEFWLDGGAYATLSAVVLSRGSLHASGPYECPNVRIRSRALATSHPPHGAFRGFGAPQSLFAIERHMDVVAKACGLTPQELRQRNVLRRGSTTASGQKIKEDVALDVLMCMAHEDIRFDERAREYAAHNASPAGLRTRKGIGAATFFHGAGFTGSGEKNLASVAAVNIAPCGSLRILVASTEMGQGAHTILAQMAADAADTEVDAAFVATPDTAHVPDSGPTVASRTTMIVGGLVEKAARALRAELDAGGFLRAGTHADADSFRKAALAAAAQRNVAPEALRQECQYVPPSGLIWDDKTYRGDAYPTFAWACYAAAVSVDLLTYEVTVEAFSAVQDIGKVINPLFAAGQVEGGVVQAIGYALSEKVEWKNGVMSNARLTNYIIPTALDVPRISVRFFEHPNGTPEAQTPKGIGELPMDGVAPALAGALEDALGVSFTRIPILPEDIFQALQAKGNTP